MTVVMTGELFLLSYLSAYQRPGALDQEHLLGI